MAIFVINITEFVINVIICVVYVTESAPRPGYLKALERGNSVPRPKGFCEADKVNCFAVLSQNLKCHDLLIIDNFIFNENILFFCKLLSTL